jgi:hypothetical protein
MHDDAAATERPFHASQWPRPIADPEAYDGGERLAITWDLGAVAEARKKQLIAAWIRRLPALRQVRRLNLWSCVTQPLFDAACAMEGLECLQIKWSHVREIDAIARLGTLRYLYIGSSTRIASVAPLAALKALRVLHIENFRSVEDFTPLAELTSLESLSVVGSLWSRQRLASLEPFARMTWLTSLALDTTGLDAVRPLANLRRLASLDLNNRLPMEEYAWLAARMPDTACRWFQPYLPLGNAIRCPRCKGDTRVMLTGRGSRMLCQVCDAAKLARHVAAFEMAKAAALDA